ncbi:TPA: hypothetical protein ACUT60_002773 [Pseudomonas aeruginosa]
MSIDWSKAPEGATHYAPKLEENDFWCSVFWRMENGVGVEAWSIDNRTGELHHLNRPTWIETTAKRLVPRPAACAHASTTWDGQGLPPVGTNCEYRSNDGWLQCEVVAHRNNAAVVLNHHYEADFVPPQDLRPIRTPEQIAAEERAKAIEEMCFAEETLTVKQAKALYDAGYRRQEEGK